MPTPQSTGSSARKRLRYGLRVATAVSDLEELEIDRYPTLPLMHRAYELRANITAL
jgi:hypothetical protein